MEYMPLIEPGSLRPGPSIEFVNAGRTSMHTGAIWCGVSLSVCIGVCRGGYARGVRRAR